MSCGFGVLVECRRPIAASRACLLRTAVKVQVLLHVLLLQVLVLHVLLLQVLLG